ncbi:hypothetical protein DVK07_10420 [Halorubrum sp. Atlit-26R]|nr:hypothetical protein DVK07_10420 [Halorubrum sp. Atlit-26R]
MNTPKHVALRDPAGDGHLISLSMDPHNPGKTWAVHGSAEYGHDGFEDHPLFAEGEQFDAAFATAVDVINGLSGGDVPEPIPDDHRPEPGATGSDETEDEAETEVESDPQDAADAEPASSDDGPEQAGLGEWV